MSADMTRRGFAKTAGGLILAGLGTIAVSQAAIPQAFAEEEAAPAATPDFDSFADIPLAQNDGNAVVDKWNVQELIAAERRYRDNAQWDKLGQCYLDESAVNLFWYRGDGRAYAQAASEQAASGSPYANPKHRLFTPTIWISGNRAIAETPCLMYSLTPLELEGERFYSVNYARLFERLEKVDGTWGIRRLDAIHEVGFIVPETPGDELEIEPTELAGFRESYRGISWMLAKADMEANQDQPGDDRPDLVEALYAEASEWLKGDGSTATEATPVAATSAMATDAKYVVSIDGYEVSADYKGNPALLVTYTWTNNSDEDKNFSFAIRDKLFQDGIELDSAIGVDGSDSSGRLKDIRPGTTQTVTKGYELFSMNDVEVEIGELFSYDSELLLQTVLTLQ